MLRSKSLIINVVEDVAGFPDLHINLPFLAFGVRGLSRHSLATADGSWFPRFSMICQCFVLFVPFVVKYFPQKSSNMLPLCYFLCYQLSP